MAGTGVASGKYVPKAEEPENCKRCKRDQCPLTCPNLEVYKRYLRERTLDT